MQIWLLPIAVLIFTTILAVPISKFLAWIMNGKYKAPAFFHWFEARLDSGPQNWKQYTAAMLIFNTVLFVFGFAVLSLQPWMPLNDLNRGMLAPTTILHSVVSFMTNTDLQHYSGDQHFSNFSQIFFGLANFFLSAVHRVLRPNGDHPRLPRRRSCRQLLRRYVARGDLHLLPATLILAVVFLQQGCPMTFKCAHVVSTLEPTAMGTTNGAVNQQTIVMGPLARLCR